MLTFTFTCVYKDITLWLNSLADANDPLYAQLHFIKPCKIFSSEKCFAHIGDKVEKT